MDGKLRSSIWWIPLAFSVLVAGVGAYAYRTLERSTRDGLSEELEMEFEALGLEHIALRVRDMDAAQAFYVGILGCSIYRVNPEVPLVQMRFGEHLTIGFNFGWLVGHEAKCGVWG